MIQQLHRDLPGLETVNLQMGAMDLSPAGEFVELRASGVRLRRVSQTHLVLETAAGGDVLHITSHFRVDVKTESGHGVPRSEG